MKEMYSFMSNFPSFSYIIIMFGSGFHVSYMGDLFLFNGMPLNKKLNEPNPRGSTSHGKQTALAPGVPPQPTVNPQPPMQTQLTIGSQSR